jgi:tRNA 2-thiouridine synthesizing protein C
MTFSTFLFCDPIPAERIRWIAAIIVALNDKSATEHPGSVKVFLTGDALFSLVDARARPAWAMVSTLPSVQIIADGDELQLQGLRDSVSSGFPQVMITGIGDQGPFWEGLVTALKEEWVGLKNAAFLLCNSPYMSRVPVYMLRFLSRVEKAGLHPELYSYLDGVHTLHDGQRPSEFENIGRGVAALAGAAVQSGRDPWFAACSRCATARGYYQMNPGTGFCEPASCIQDITIRPLKEILARFSSNHPIVSHASGAMVPGAGRRGGVPHLVVFITNPPYCTEWTFGGMSLALAAAMDGIPTRVIFIEEGVYALHGTHEVPKNDKVFNIQEMVAVTIDVNTLQYFVHAPSLEDRGIDISGAFYLVRKVTNEDLARILFPPDNDCTAPAIRMIFF